MFLLIIKNFHTLTVKKFIHSFSKFWKWSILNIFGNNRAGEVIVREGGWECCWYFFFDSYCNKNLREIHLIISNMWNLIWSNHLKNFEICVCMILFFSQIYKKAIDKFLYPLFGNFFRRITSHIQCTVFCYPPNSRILGFS